VNEREKKKKENADETLHTLFHRSSVFSTASQPKALAATSDNTTFVVGTDTVEAVRNNQKVADFRPGANPTAIAAAGSLVAIGFAVRGTMPKVRSCRGVCSPSPLPHLFFFFFRIRKFGCTTGMARRSGRLAFWKPTRVS